MKKSILLGILAVMKTFCYAQDLNPENTVTALSIKNIQSNQITIQWQSAESNGDFSIYINNRRILDKSTLKKSQLISQTNLSGVRAKESFIYEYTFSILEEGEYYLAVLPYSSSYVATAVSSLDIYNSNVPELYFVPEMNISIYPIYIKRSLVKNKTQNKSLSRTVVTGLNILSEQDLFKITWSVYPKSLDEYVFIVYRSRYPLNQYLSTEGLPEYARVTNQFSFTDANINFDVPYYYAVVSENSGQWDIGINVFNTPAVLIKNILLVNTPAKVEYRKKKENATFNSKNQISEEALDVAVQLILSNLNINISSKNGIGNNSYDTNELFQNFRIVLETNNLLFSEELKLVEEKIISEDALEVQGILQRLTKFNNDINLLDTKTKVLLGNNTILGDFFLKSNLMDYINLRNKVSEDRIELINKINQLEINRENRENLFLSNAVCILKKEETAYQNLMSSYKKEMKSYEKSSKISNISSDILYRMKNGTNTDNIRQFEGNLSETLVDEFSSLREPLTVNVKERINGIQKSYENIPMEHVQNIKDIGYEQPIIGREEWIKRNYLLIKQKQKDWKKSTKLILTDSVYRQWENKWFSPSETIARKEGIKAFQRGNFDEALYLLTSVPTNLETLLWLGQTFYMMGAYEEAFSVFLMSLKLGISESETWLDKSIQKIIDTK